MGVVFQKRVIALHLPLFDAFHHAADDVGAGHEIEEARYVPVVDDGFEALQKLDISCQLANCSCQ